MRHARRTPSHWLFVTPLLTALLAALALGGCAGVGPTPQPPAPYLALGDSITFGYTPLADPSKASNYSGYPNDVASALGLALTNAACPGATSSYLVSLAGVDWNCASYRSQHQLHVSYSTSQLDYAVAFLRAHPTTRLVTLNIGLNDLIRDQSLCGDNILCVEFDLATTIMVLSNDLDTIYSALRTQARYSGPIVALTYYSLNYADTTETGNIQAINSVLTDRAHRWNALVADGFGAFQRASAPFNGDPCAAGLLVRVAATTCDLHPSPKGHTLLANAILAVTPHPSATPTAG